MQIASAITEALIVRMEAVKIANRIQRIQHETRNGPTLDSIICFQNNLGIQLMRIRNVSSRSLRFARSMVIAAVLLKRIINFQRIIPDETVWTRCQGMRTPKKSFHIMDGCATTSQ